MVDVEIAELTAEARAEFERQVEEMTVYLKKNPTDSSAYYNRGIAHSGLKQYETAIADYNKAIEFKHDYAEAYNNRGAAYSCLKQYEAAIDDFDKAIELRPKEVQSYQNRGDARVHLKQYESAIADYDRVIELKPYYVEAYNNRGNAHCCLQQYEAAIADFDKAIFLGPKDVHAYNNRGKARNDLKQYEAAIADFDIALKLKPGFAAAYCNRGVALIGLKRYGAAIADCDRAIELKPDFDGAYNNRGNAHCGLKQYEAAIADFDKAIELDPINPSFVHNRAVAMAFQASEKEREEMSARLEEGFNEKLEEAIEKQSVEIRDELEQQTKKIGNNLQTLAKGKKRHEKTARRLSFFQFSILAVWLYCLVYYFNKYVLNAPDYHHPMAYLPYVSVALIISTPVIWGLKIVSQNILEAKSLKEDAIRRLFIENNLARILIADKPEEQKIRQEMLAGYFTSWQNNSPVEILLQLNSRRIGPETFLDKIFPSQKGTDD